MSTIDTPLSLDVVCTYFVLDQAHLLTPRLDEKSPHLVLNSKGALEMS